MKHGVTKSHRRPGCIGSGRDKSRVWPRQKMPGHMGGDQVWMPGLRVLRINYQEDVLYIMGQAVPGDNVGGTANSHCDKLGDFMSHGTAVSLTDMCQNNR